jgi:hypothetical protein
MPRIFALVIVGLLLLACDQAGSANDAPHTTKAAHNAGPLPAPSDVGRTVTVYKSATCGCCVKWADHLEENGFRVVLHDVEELGKIKRQFSIPSDMRSCHTATIGEYVIEGHVPASDIEELLGRRPPQRLLTVPGMPLGSPGMEHPNGSVPYESLLVAKDGSVTVFKRHAPNP